MPAMSNDVLVPWQSYFFDEVLHAGRQLMLRDLVSRLSINRKNTIKGQVKVRSSYDCCAQLAGLNVSENHVLRATAVTYHCPCARGWSGCEHVTALILAHAVANGHLEPDADEIEAGRAALDARENGDDENESDDFWDEDDEDTDDLPRGDLWPSLDVAIRGQHPAKIIGSTGFPVGSFPSAG